MIDKKECKQCLIVLLILVLAGVLGFVWMVPSGEDRSLGACLVGVGIFNVLLRRVFGRQSYGLSPSMPSFVAKSWERIGKNGAELLYFGIGIILITIGFFLLMKSFWSAA
jgi:hypothetical protein